jgi:hypothetical protein
MCCETTIPKPVGATKAVPLAEGDSPTFSPSDLYRNKGEIVRRKYQFFL